MHSVLIVEDEKLIRQGIKTMVLRSGIPVDMILECNNGEAAMEILRTQPIDVMFTDIRMPKMDGIQLVKEMQSLEHVPLTVAVSGYDDFSYAVEMLRMGVREYLLKPVDRDNIKKILEKLNTEIMDNHESSIQNITLGCQQLKYYILNDNISDKEKEALISQYEETFFSAKYRICLLNRTDKETRMESEYIYLNDVDGDEVYIIQEESVGMLLQDELLERYTGVSNSHKGLAELKEAYLEAKEARREAFILSRNVVNYGDRVIKDKVSGLEIDDIVIGQIVQKIGTDKYEEAIHQLERIFKNAGLGGYQPAILEENIDTLIRDLETTYQNIYTEEKLGGSVFYHMYQSSCLEEFEKEFLGFIMNFSVKLNQHFDDYKNKLKIKQAVDFIRDNYDKDLNMAVVSNQISMNYSLFSYVFKQYTGSNFVNYLKEIRIEAAKKLLAETDMKIIDISQKVGYENEKHFMKTFKSVCGVSASEFRKNSQLGS